MLDYIFIYLTAFVINIVPALMPPTWILLAFAHHFNNALDPFLLALGGALASTAGRYVLSWYTSKFKTKIVSRKRIKKMDLLGNLARKNKVTAFILVFLVSLLTPFPSNALFIMLGLADAFELSMFLGFFLGRFVQYYIAIISLHFMYRSFDRFFAHSFLSIVLFDVTALVILIIFSLIDWEAVITKKKLKFLKFKLR